MLPEKYMIFDEKYKFNTMFDMATGSYMRTGILDNDGNDTGIDPFMASFPHLLDIGIMGHCSHGLSRACSKAGIQCYQSGGLENKPNMRLENFKDIVDQCSGKVHQFALGGRGDPDQHEDFEEILAYSRKKGIVPNITTSGFLLDKNKAEIISKYCGAAAVSWYRTSYTYKAIELLVAAGVYTNIHFVLGNDSIEEAIDIVETGNLPKGVKRIVFLLFKPIGMGVSDNVLKSDDPRVGKLFEIFDRPDKYSFIGYDSCSVSGLASRCSNIDPQSYDTCEGGRFSAFISSELVMTPCSFDRQEKYGESIKDKTISEVWESKAFSSFRGKLSTACPDCIKRNICMGGCPIVPIINLCSDKLNLSESEELV
jgi:radical SAM protein with 4Fe4S-binding SPASM domain